MDGILIRPYQISDRQQVRHIAWETAFLGEPASAFFDGQEILEDFLTLYFTDEVPESCFVAEFQGSVVGYLIGAKDPKRMNRLFQTKILPPLFFKAVVHGIFLKRINLIFFFRCFLSFTKGEFRMPDFFKKYPAVLHINLKKGFRASGFGSKLMNAYLEYLRKERVEGVRLATLSDQASLFFKKQGFVLLHQGKRSYFRYLLNRDLSAYIFAKKIF